MSRDDPTPTRTPAGGPPETDAADLLARAADSERGSALGNLDAIYRRLVDNLAEYAVLLLDRQGRVLTWNAGAQAMKGWAPQEVIGESFKRFYTSEAVAVGHPDRELEVAALTGRYEEEGWRVRRDGTRFWAKVLILAIHDDDGEVTAFGKVTSDLTARRQAEEQLQNVLGLLEQTIRIDHLTGLANRRAWDERLAEEVSRVRRESTGLALAMIDIDHFKQVNDRRGHAAGDQLLKRCALRWRQAIRPTDLLARYGGEEFALALPGCDLSTGRTVVERLMAATPNGHTCSIGLAAWDGEETLDELLGRADRAMYEAKREGRSRIAIDD